MDHFLDQNNKGDCQDYRNEKRWCYVYQPSNCTDLNQDHNGLGWSFEACEHKESKHPELNMCFRYIIFLGLIWFLKYLSYFCNLRLYKIESGKCSCHNFTDIDGYGNCQKGHPNKNNLNVCYVNQPNNCPDTLQSGALRGREISAYACKQYTKNYSNQFLYKNNRNLSFVKDNIRLY